MRNPPPVCSRCRVLRFEALETRHLLAITVAFNGTDLTITSNAADDNIAVAAANGDVTVNGATVPFGIPAQNASASAVTKIDIIGNGGIDNIDLTGLDTGGFAGLDGKIVVYCGTGTDSVQGSKFNEFIDGEDDADFLYGNGGNDTINGGIGVWIDAIYGGEGE